MRAAEREREKERESMRHRVKEKWDEMKWDHKGE